MEEHGVVYTVTIANEIVMVKLDELAVIKRGLEYFEDVQL
jgi:hypothetical protein